MRVILSEDVPKVGKKNEVKEVSDGYARNFLLAKGLAKLATESALKQLEAERELLAKKSEEELKVQEEIVTQIDGQEIEITAKADENGKLYGSITAAKIAKVLNDKGFNISKKNIKLEESIKELGEYDINLEMDHGLEAKIKIIINEELSDKVPEEDSI